MERTQRWRLERRVSVSVLVQLLTLAGLIVGSWVNLQRQLDLVSHDVKQLLAHRKSSATSSNTFRNAPSCRNIACERSNREPRIDTNNKPPKTPGPPRLQK